MRSSVTAQHARKLVGQPIYAVRKDGGIVTGKLVRVSGNRLYVRPEVKGKPVRTKAILPLVLFDLLAIGTAPYAYGYGYGGYGGYGYPYVGYGYPGFFW